MVKKFVGAAGIALAMSACGGSADTEADANSEGAISAEEARDTMVANADAMRPEPGQYKMTMSVAKIEIPNAPKGMADMMGDGFGMNFNYCLTQEEADKGFEESIRKGREDNCTYERMNLDGGKIDVAMKCNDPDSGRMEGTMTGTVTPTKMDLTFKGKQQMGPMGDAEMEMTIEHERIGDCEK